jgi:hypothetical protein
MRGFRAGSRSPARTSRSLQPLRERSPESPVRATPRRSCLVPSCRPGVGSSQFATSAEGVRVFDRTGCYSRLGAVCPRHRWQRRSQAPEAPPQCDSGSPVRSASLCSPADRSPSSARGACAAPGQEARVAGVGLSVGSHFPVYICAYLSTDRLISRLSYLCESRLRLRYSDPPS